MWFDRADRKLYQRIWKLTWPVMVSNAGELAVSLVDLWLVRPFGPSATAAIGIGRQVTFLAEAMAVVITASVITLVSQGVGARSIANRRLPIADCSDKSTIDKVVRQSAGLVLLLGLPSAIAGCWLSGPLLVGLQASDETRAYGEPYLQVYFAGIIFTWGYLVGAALFRGAGDVRTPLRLALGVSLLQVVLNYLFIYGAGPLPAFEVQGAAIGAVAARACGMLAFLFLLLRGAGHLRLRWLPPRSRFGLGIFDWELIGSMLRIGVPMALANMLRYGSRVVFVAIVGASTLHESLQAAVSVALLVRQTPVQLALAFQIGTATLVGQSIGRDDFHEADALGRRSVRLLALLMAIISGVLIILADPLAELFIKAPEVVGLGAKVLRWFAIGQFFSALSIGMQGVLMGGGDTLPAMCYTLVSEWLLMLPLAYFFVVADWVPDGLLAAWALAPAVTLALMQRRFRSGRWKKREDGG